MHCIAYQNGQYAYQRKQHATLNNFNSELNLLIGINCFIYRLLQLKIATDDFVYILRPNPRLYSKVICFSFVIAMAQSQKLQPPSHNTLPS